MALARTALLFLFHAAGIISRCRGSAAISPDRLSNVTKTLAYLLEGYDIRLRPNFAGDTLLVGMELTIGSFDSISEVNMDYTLTLYLNQYWKDDRLSFSTADEVFNLSGDFAEKIWVPDTFFANDKSSFLHDVTEKNKMVRLYGDGSIVYGMRFTTTLACMMDLHYYPLDSQNCTVEIESYGYTVGDVKMYWREVPVVGVEKIELPQFTILDHDTSDRIEGLATGRYQRLSLSFRMQRNIGYFIFQTYLPSILIVMLSWVSFWINHEATSARVALGITTVLTMTTISTGVRSSLPRISYVKAIDIYLVMCFIFVFAALLEFAAVNYTYWGARAKRKANRRKNDGLDGSGARARRKSDEIIELQEVRMSPIPSLRQRHGGQRGASGGNATEADAMKFPPSFRLVGVNHAYAYPHHHHRGGSGIFYTARHHHAARGQHYGATASGAPSSGRRKMLQNLRRRAHSFRIALPKIKDVNVIDKFSRVIFPVSFILFNLGYWGFYIL